MVPLLVVAGVCAVGFGASLMFTWASRRSLAWNIGFGVQLVVTARGNQKRQIVVKASVGLNVSGGSNYANAPVFVFLRLLPNNNDPAVVQIP